MFFAPVSKEAMAQRASFAQTKATPTKFQRLFSVAVPVFLLLGSAPLYQFFASRLALTIVYYIGVGITVLVNVVIVIELVASIAWHRRCRRLSQNDAISLGQKHTAAVISAYLPNEPVCGLQETMRAAMKLQRAPRSHLTVVLGHNGGTEAKMEKLKRMVKDLRTEIAEEDEPFVHLVSLYHPKSKSKAENVNGSMEYLSASEKKLRPEVVALYDADHQPNPDSMKIACADLEALGADIVQGRCIIRSGSWIIGLEFDVIYSIFHSGGRLVRGFGLFGGTNGFWRFDVLNAIRMNPARLTEDIDSGIRAIRGGYKVSYNPMICSHEEAPPDFSSLTKQRLRWAQGWAEVSLYHMSTAFERNPSLTLRSRLHLILLLQLREIFPYLVIHAAIASVIYLGREPFDWTVLSVLLTLLTALMFVLPGANMIVSAFLTKGTHIHLQYRWYHRIGYVLVAPFYEIFKSVLALWGHGRNIFGVTSWNVTTRATADLDEDLEDTKTGSEDLSDYEDVETGSSVYGKKHDRKHIVEDAFFVDEDSYISDISSFSTPQSHTQAP